MLTFHELPPTAETTDVDASAVRKFANGIENRCINGVAEVCASLVMSQDNVDPHEAEAIGNKLAAAITELGYPRAEVDANCFSSRFNVVVGYYATQGAAHV